MTDILPPILRLVVILLVTAPIATLVHELGHAAVALRLTPGPVRVWLGRAGGPPQIRLGRLEIRVCPLTLFTGFCTYYGKHPRRVHVAIIAAGPTASVLVGIAVTVPALTGPLAGTVGAREMGWLLGAPALLHGVLTAVPYRIRARSRSAYAGMATDGLMVWWLLRSDEGGSANLHSFRRDRGETVRGSGR